MPSSFFDSHSSPPDPSGSDDPQPGPVSRRAFIGVRFKCCRMYGRIYRDDEGRSFVGRCPKCGSFLTIPIGPGGSSSRFFDAG